MPNSLDPGWRGAVQVLSTVRVLLGSGEPNVGRMAAVNSSLFADATRLFWQEQRVIFILYVTSGGAARAAD